MQETVIEEFTNVEFIQGKTKMNQTNWQTYFGAALPSGIYSGLMVQDYYGNQTFDYPQILTDGVVFANGIYAKIGTDGYTDIGRIDGTTSVKDRFICIRVWLQEEKAQIVQKTNIAEYSTNISQFNSNVYRELMKFMDNESYLCTRNSYYYDIPVFYQSYEDPDCWLSRGRSLRRVIDLQNKSLVNPNLIGTEIPEGGEAHSLLISGNNYYSGYVNRVYMDYIDPPHDAMLYVRSNSNTFKVYFDLYNWINKTRGSINPTYITSLYIFSGNTSGVNTTYRYISVLEDETVTLHFTLAKEEIDDSIVGFSYIKRTYLVEVL